MNPMHHSTRRRDALLALGAAAAGLALPARAADAYPSRPITLVVGFPPGGSNDIVARLFAPTLGEILGQTVIVENRPGANAIIGTEHTARSAPDGYTLTLGNASPLVISPFTYPKMPYDTLRDLTPITTVAGNAELVALNPSVPVKDLKELTALAKTRDVTIASSGNGGLPHLAIELLKLATGGRIVHVPYKGAGPAITDAIGGHVDGIIVDIAGLYEHVRAGRLKAVAVTDKVRSSVLPEVPTSVEQGMPSLIAVNWFGIMGPAKLPPEIVKTVHAALVKTAANPELVEKLRKLGIEPNVQKSPEAFVAFIKEDLLRWGEVAKRSGARADA
ncbi:tripartite tricarboxylate transporter substrate binding protein BugE [soil metagenome]